jgi:hypothetical protein
LQITVTRWPARRGMQQTRAWAFELRRSRGEALRDAGDVKEIDEHLGPSATATASSRFSSPHRWSPRVKCATDWREASRSTSSCRPRWRV